MKTGSGADQCPALHVDARSNLSRNSCSLGGREKPSQSRRTLRVTMTFIEPSLRVAGERASSRNRRADGVLSSFCLRQRSGDRLLTPNRWCEPPREERMRRKRLLRDPLVERFEDSLSRRPRWPLLDALALPPEIVDGTFGRDPLHDPRVARSRSSRNVWCQMRWQASSSPRFRICHASTAERPRAPRRMSRSARSFRRSWDRSCRCNLCLCPYALDFVSTVREGDSVAATPERHCGFVRHRR